MTQGELGKKVPWKDGYNMRHLMTLLKGLGASYKVVQQKSVDSGF